MVKTSFILEQIGNLIEKYSNDEETQREFRTEVERRYFPAGEYKEDLYEVDEATVQSWRQQMPKLTRDNVEVWFADYYKGTDETVLCIGIMVARGKFDENGFRRNIVIGTAGQALSELYTAITDKVISDLNSIPEIIALNLKGISHGDGDEGAIYFIFKGNVDFEA